MQQVSPSSANDVRSPDREERSGGVVNNWHGAARSMPPQSWRTVDVAPVGVHAYFNGVEDFNLIFEVGVTRFDVWTTAEGLEAVIASCQAALVRARIERESVAA